MKEVNKLIDNYSGKIFRFKTIENGEKTQNNSIYTVKKEMWNAILNNNTKL